MRTHLSRWIVEEVKDVMMNSDCVDLGHSSFLSRHVWKLLCDVDSWGEASSNGLIGKNLTINMDKLQQILPDEVSTSEYFIGCVEILRPTLIWLHQTVSSWDLSMVQQYYGPRLAWTGQTQILESCFSLLSSDGASVLHALLLLTSTLEHALGDLYLLKGKQCPSMLKDLLTTGELTTLISGTMMQLLRIILGPPISLNLRNVVWHGFPSEGELHPLYGFLLLCVMASIGEHLDSQGILANSIPHRELLTMPQAQRLDSILPTLNGTDEQMLRDLFITSSFIAPSQRSFWLRVIDLYMSERWGECACLLLPQLEHGLRQMFAAVNNCPHRVLTAESSEFFTTFDEMLVPALASGESNALRSTLSDPLMDSLMDVLRYPEGPSVRDKISHGEADISRFPQGLANHLLCLSAAICGKQLNETSSLWKVPAFRKIIQRCDDYQSVFHPIALLKEELCALCSGLDTWEDHPRPTIQQVPGLEDWHQMSPVAEMIQQAGRALLVSHNMEDTGWHRFLQLSESLENLIENVAATSVHTLFRFHEKSTSKTGEEELIGLLRRIIHEGQSVHRLVQQAARHWYQLWQSKQLSSRKRNTYKRMLNSLPVICRGMSLVVLCVACHVHQLSQPWENTAANMRLLKQLLSCVENLRTYSHMDRNRWEEAVVLIKDLSQHILSLHEH